MIYTFETKLKQDETSSLMWDYRIIVPHEYHKSLLEGNKRVLCGINGLPKIHAALLSNGAGDYFVMVNKEIRKKLKIETGDTLSITIEKDTSKYGMAVPEAFTELCHQDPEGNDVFHSLTPGKQRTLLHIMGKPKSEQKQLEKVLIVFDYLKSVNGELDFKELNEAFKNNRFKL
jgi:bifunctional DNA-binding transcriptional regulator/antitoxin component of YhaV-PrlF toxin-antitoxin module